MMLGHLHIPPFVPSKNVRPVVSVSGGKDSTATYLLALERTGICAERG